MEVYDNKVSYFDRQFHQKWNVDLVDYVMKPAYMRPESFKHSWDF